MKKEEGILVKTKELKRLKVIEQVIEKKIGQRQAGILLKLSVRQIRRLVKQVKKEGLQGLIHRLRGKPSNQRHEESFKEKVLNVCRKKYEDFGPTLASEKLEELDQLCVNRETLRQWMMAEGLWELRRKGSKHLEWRERRACFGEMIQIDGSHHDWLEGRGPKLVLMGSIDDATSEVFAKFYDYEGTMPAMDSFYRYSKKYGLPHSIYIDRLRAYQGDDGKLSIEEELEGKKRAQSQFERALEELGVDVIHAQSPQAKGRVERLFRTFQDRLIKEMRLAGIKTKEEANRFLETYLPKYNHRFSVKPRNEANLHRPALRDRELRQILSIQEKRIVRNDYTIRYGTRLYQLLNLENAKRLKKVVVQERIDGKIYVVDQGKDLAYRELKEPLRRNPEIKKKAKKPSKLSHPRMDHPFKRKGFENYLLRKRAKTEGIGSQSQKTSHLNAFTQTISAKDNPTHHPNSTYQHREQFQQKEESSKEEKELLLIH